VTCVQSAAVKVAAASPSFVRVGKRHRDKPSVVEKLASLFGEMAVYSGTMKYINEASAQLGNNFTFALSWVLTSCRAIFPLGWHGQCAHGIAGGARSGSRSRSQDYQRTHQHDELG